MPSKRILFVFADEQPLANALEHEEHDGEKTNTASRLDQDYVNKLGLAAKIEEFKETCQPEQV